MKSDDPTGQVDPDGIGDLVYCLSALNNPKTSQNKIGISTYGFKISQDYHCQTPHLSQVISPAFAHVEELVPGSKPWSC